MAWISRPNSGSDFVHLDLHLPGDLAIAEVAFDAAAQARDVLRLGEIHFEQEARPGAERQQIMRAGRGQAMHRVERRPHRALVDLGRAGIAAPAAECRIPGRPSTPGGTSGSGGGGADRGRRRYRSRNRTRRGRRGSRRGSRRAACATAIATSITSARCRSLQPHAISYNSRNGRSVTG